MTETPEHRSWTMSRVRGKDTAPEMRVRRLLHSLGYRYRLHAKDLPGKPDIVFRGRKKAVFIHGCFWHRHDDPTCKLARLPKSNLDFWVPKLERNVERDRIAYETLQGIGWHVFVVWECQLKNPAALQKELITFLDRARDE
ncbi:DNA mismatch endonuclease (patch repair protein) [Rhizobium sp. BK181]|uniref:very short patch repair endonuclease n=1 Tax=Rhizobium sp. BK181 TaxID=2587072 RepID=UPI0017DBB1BA|nr:very short patch repair endonuclease [Rhizobium sp. BK181]MBB3318954.1 DNA mismatch endonuclease (patch repair protein) [Rhizobium sp. BK181]